eukprot:TRINITY_DN4390_c0_g1_i1.p3 TRINITY_DN4390_c0_g1~~TRINITY_DN4390_c0_g1_i1.p3  ORF type:complete len:135 (+),score=11.06 TRINITY_DN4390_c0_g1_i1:387-791(+)
MPRTKRKSGKKAERRLGRSDYDSCSRCGRCDIHIYPSQKAVADLWEVPSEISCGWNQSGCNDAIIDSGTQSDSPSTEPAIVDFLANAITASSQELLAAFATRCWHYTSNPPTPKDTDSSTKLPHQDYYGYRPAC